MADLLTAPGVDLGPLVPRVHRVRATYRETADTVTLELEPAAGVAPVRCDPGQFTMLGVLGVGEVPISSSGDPQADVLVHTVREVGAATGALCRLEVGDAVGVRGPFGNGWPVEQAVGVDVVCVAGGIGIAPLRPVVMAQLAGRLGSARCSLLVGSRSPADLVFANELGGWGAAGVELRVTVDQPAARWSGHVGLVTKLIPTASFDPTSAVAFVCGPEIMMRRTASTLVELGVDPERVHVSLERNMRCGIGHCGHCQLGAVFVCVDGPVVPWPLAARLLEVRER